MPMTRVARARLAATVFETVMSAFPSHRHLFYRLKVYIESYAVFNCYLTLRKKIFCIALYVSFKTKNGRSVEI